MNKHLESKLMYISYEIQSKIKCNYCSYIVNPINNRIEIKIEIPIIREIIMLPFYEKYIMERSAENLIQEIIETVENGILNTYVRIQEEK